MDSFDMSRFDGVERGLLGLGVDRGPSELSSDALAAGGAGKSSSKGVPG